MEAHKNLLRFRLGTGTPSLFSHSIGQSNLKNKNKNKTYLCLKKENRLPFLMGVVVKSHCRGDRYKAGKELVSFLQLICIYLRKLQNQNNKIKVNKCLLNSHRSSIISI